MEGIPVEYSGANPVFGGCKIAILPSYLCWVVPELSLVWGHKRTPPPAHGLPYLRCEHPISPACRHRGHVDRAQHNHRLDIQRDLSWLGLGDGVVHAERTATSTSTSMVLLAIFHVLLTAIRIMRRAPCSM